MGRLEKSMPHMTVKKPLSERVSAPARKILMTLEKPSVEMYALERCQMCNKELEIKEINQSIMKGIPPLCNQHQKTMSEQIAQLAPMMQNLRLL